jgi:glycosyltransferase involved in cell wall biosynthesis
LKEIPLVENRALPTVAVIIPVFNAEDLLAETLSSVLGQDHGDYTVYIVDDGSTDRTRAVVAGFASDARVRYLHQENQGQAAAINRAIREGTEPWITLCDADDLWRPDRLGRAISALRADPSLGMVCNDFAKGSDPGQPWVSAWRTLGYRPLSGHAFERLLEQNFVPRSGVLIPRSVLGQVGDFSESIGGRCGCDDWDMWLKIARERPILCMPETLTFKRVVAGQHSGRLGQSQSRVLLWEHWESQLRSEDRHLHKKAVNQLSKSLVGLSYKLIVENQSRSQARRALVRAARCGASPSLVLRMLIRSYL